MTQVFTLAGALSQAATELKALEPPPALRQRVLSALASAQARRRPARNWAWGSGAACAAVLLGSALLMLREPALDTPFDAVLGSDRALGFLPLVPAERWPRDAAQAWLVSTEVSSTRLAALGLPFDPAHAGDSVRAELLVRESGEVLAVRLVR